MLKKDRVGSICNRSPRAPQDRFNTPHSRRLARYPTTIVHSPGVPLDSRSLGLLQLSLEGPAMTEFGNVQPLIE